MMRGDINLFVVGFCIAFAVASATEGRAGATLIQCLIAGANLAVYIYLRSNPLS